MQMDKVTLGFLADILYIKDIICYEEHEAIMSAKRVEDVDAIVEKMLRGDFNGYKKGEANPKRR